MKTSEKGIKFIEEFEALFLQSYDDLTERIVGPGDTVRGVLTIGYGHTDSAGPPQVYPGMVITKKQAEDILASDLHSVEANVNHHVTVPLKQHQFDALVSFDFNTGGLSRSSALRDVNSNRFDRVPADLAMWNKAGGRVLKGLVRRRKAEGLMFSKGEYNAYPV